MMVNQPLPWPRIAGLMPVLMLFFAIEIAPEAPQEAVPANQGDFETKRRQRGEGCFRIGKRRIDGNSNGLNKPVQHLLLAGLVEIDGELVAFDGRDVAVAEFLMEDSVAD